MGGLVFLALFVAICFGAANPVIGIALGVIGLITACIWGRSKPDYTDAEIAAFLALERDAKRVTAMHAPPAVMRPNTHAIYVIGSRSGGHVKVGYSVNPAKRLKQLQTGSPVRLEVLKTRWYTSENDARQAEAKLHKQHRKHRTNGEWFNLPAETINL